MKGWVSRLSLSVAVTLAVVIAASFFAYIHITPWGTLLFGQLRISTRGHSVSEPWFKGDPAPQYLSWSIGLASIFGTDGWWLSHGGIKTQAGMLRTNATGQLQQPVRTYYLIRVPLIYPTLVFAATAWWIYQRTIQPGLCHCGYNLTGNTSGRCPECGRTL